MRIMLKPGDTLIVGFDDENDIEGDAAFIIEYGPEVLRIMADMPDTTGREGVIYEERFGDPEGLEEPAEVVHCLHLLPPTPPPWDDDLPE